MPGPLENILLKGTKRSDRAIPKTWRLKAAGILRAGKPGTVLMRQRARRDGASLTSDLSKTCKVDPIGSQL